MPRLALVAVLVALAGCDDDAQNGSTEAFCPVVQELEAASDASVAAVFGQGFDSPVLTPAQVQEALDRLRDIEGRLREAAPDDAPDALDRYLDVRSDYMDAVEGNGFDPDPDSLDGGDPRVQAWSDDATRALEGEVSTYVATACPA